MIGAGLCVVNLTDSILRNPYRNRPILPCSVSTATIMRPAGELSVAGLVLFIASVTESAKHEAPRAESKLNKSWHLELAKYYLPNIERKQA